MMGSPRQAPRDSPPPAPRPVEYRENQRHGKVPHDREGFYPRNGYKSFAIMKGARECEASGLPGAGVTICAAPGRRPFHDGRCPGLHASSAARGPYVGECLGGWKSSGDQLLYLSEQGQSLAAAVDPDVIASSGSSKSSEGV
jgi:hypothetical protein